MEKGRGRLPAPCGFATDVHHRPRSRGSPPPACAGHGVLVRGVSCQVDATIHRPGGSDQSDPGPDHGTPDRTRRGHNQVSMRRMESSAAHRLERQARRLGQPADAGRLGMDERGAPPIGSAETMRAGSRAHRGRGAQHRTQVMPGWRFRTRRCTALPPSSVPRSRAHDIAYCGRRSSAAYYFDFQRGDALKRSPGPGPDVRKRACTDDFQAILVRRGDEL